MNNSLNYPTLKKSSTNQKTVDYGNRGMNLENDLNSSNDYYNSIGRAVIHKKPLPVQIVSVDYRSRSTAKITEAYFKVPSTTDYNGIYKGYYLDFDAKETTCETSFPLRQIHPHQLEHLYAVIKQKGLAFLIIRFTKSQTDYLLLAKDLQDFIKTNKRKSLPRNWIVEKAYLLKNSLSPRICYLDMIDIIIKDNNYL